MNSDRRTMSDLPRIPGLTQAIDFALYARLQPRFLHLRTVNLCIYFVPFGGIHGNTAQLLVEANNVNWLEGPWGVCNSHLLATSSQ